MTNNNIKLVSWNTRGYGRYLRRTVIRKFLRKPENRDTIILLQELKVRDKTKLEARVKAILPGAYVDIDYTPSGRGGSAIIVPNHLPMLDAGKSGTGNAVWVQVQTKIGNLNIMSIHTPNDKDVRIDFWERLYTMIQSGKWILGGDFNMVELPDDSKGKSALATGAEARSWKSLTNKYGLVDAYLCSATTTGGCFTRYAFCGQSYDQARLDRFYLTDGGIWTHLIKGVTHHTDQVVSDHVPISLDCILQQQPTTDWIPKNYFKMDENLLKRQGVLQRVQQEWSNHPPDAGNPQCRWQLAWLRVKQVLKQEKKKHKEEMKQYHDLQVELRHLRQLPDRTGDTNTTEAIQRLKNVQETLRQQEQKDARAWRIRSKQHWLKEGEAPSRYFFAQFKAKMARESIKELVLPNEEVTTDRSSIIQEVQQFMTTLYTREEDSHEKQEARQAAFQCVTTRVTNAQDRMMSSLPTDQEIDQTAHLMKREKSPGLVGLTSEVLLHCWAFTRQDCLDMVKHFWDQPELLKGTRTAVIKMIPKNDQKQLLKNWRPLSLMSLTYKIIAKIAAERLKKIIPGLVNHHQTGFIHGRSIVSNLLSLQLAADWAKISEQKCMFMKLDFVKAYDRVDHVFLLGTLQAMGFSQQTIRILRGLIIQGWAKMDQTVFQNTAATLEQYELASGAKLNLSKTLVVPIGEYEIPPWLAKSSCTVATQTDRFRYLGLLLGINVLDKEVVQELKLKYEKKLLHWTSKLLSWPEKILLAQSILRALPNYTMMAIGISNGDAHILEKITTDFIWGRNNTGKIKRHPIAWRILSKKKQHGRLGWPKLEDLANAFLLKNSIKVLQNENTEWVKLARVTITHTLKRSSHPKEVKEWDPTVALLGLKTLKIPGSSILNRMLKAWFKVRKKQTWNPDNGDFPADVTPMLAIAILDQTGTNDTNDKKNIITVCRKLKIQNFKQLRRADGTYDSLTQCCLIKGITLSVQQQVTLNKIETILPPHQMTGAEWHESRCWRWDPNITGKPYCWGLSTRQWRTLLYTVKEDNQDLNSRWDLSNADNNWTSRWIKLWSGSTTFRKIIRCWRFLRLGYFTNSKAHSNGSEPGDQDDGDSLLVNGETEEGDKHSGGTITYWATETKRWMKGECMRNQNIHSVSNPQDTSATSILDDDLAIAAGIRLRTAPDNRPHSPRSHLDRSWTEEEMIKWEQQEDRNRRHQHRAKSRRLKTKQRPRTPERVNGLNRLNNAPTREHQSNTHLTDNHGLNTWTNNNVGSHDLAVSHALESGSPLDQDLITFQSFSHLLQYIQQSYATVNRRSTGNA
ncbi:hypothetical protein R1sor_023655 [Riccia sorocarpa]|uniref:Reverse transcriptase domain-containing protein n=1 Tax=Riccia sorocarpa TaxID=122646 RepID=A0ABD3GQJ6_9MARC